MPVIREYQRQTQAAGPVQGPRVTPDQLGAGAGRALQNLGRAANASVTGVEKALDQKNASEVSVNLSRANADLARDLEQLVRTAEPGDAKAFEDYNKRVDDTLTEVGENATSPTARRMFAESSAKIKGHMHNASAGSQADLAGVKAVTDYSTILNNLSSAALSSPSSLDLQIDQHSKDMDRLVTTGQLPKTKALELKARGQKEIAVSSVLGWIRLNPDYARRKLDGKDLDDFLDGTDKAGLYSRLDALDNQKKTKINSLEKLKFKDPWAFFTEAGEKYGTIKFGDPNSLGTTLIDRKAFIEDARTRHGLRQDEVPFLNPAEAKGVASFLKDSEAKDINAFLINLDKNADSDMQKRISEQVFKVDPGMGIALSVSSEAPDVSQGIIAGRKLFNAELEKRGGSAETGKTGFLLPSDTRVKEDFDTYVGNAISDPDLRVKIRDAAFYHSANKTFESGGSLAELDSSQFQDSLESIVGPQIDINDRRIFSFRDKSGKFVDDSEFVDAFENLTDDMLMATHKDTLRTASGENLNALKSQGRLSPIQVGDGLYMLKRDNELVLDSKGKPFELDMKSIVEYQRKIPKEKPKGSDLSRRGVPL